MVISPDIHHRNVKTVPGEDNQSALADDQANQSALAYDQPINLLIR
jgi:hypothetical protein